ncbi:MAG TPA: exodeoxyribonuclease V subunit beta, partial [Pseudomonadales bacterium]|nr:exodeoxyribonuclease V subunit beta [Pseudomonadales bacterium]
VTESDVFIQQILQAFPASSYVMLAGRLDWAEKQMDTAAIFTLHGFCQRMLTQNAFECGQLFELNLVKDANNLLTLALLDFWRESVLPLSEQEMALVYQQWSNPLALLADIKPALLREHVALEPRDNTTDLSSVITAFISRLNAFKRDWLNAASEIDSIIQKSAVNKNVYSKKHLPNWLARVSDFCHSALDSIFPAAMNRFSASCLATECENGSAPQHVLFDEIDRLLIERQRFIVVFKTLAITSIKARINTFKHQQQVLSFQDLLTRLDVALQTEGGARLAEKIRTRYPVAMIDEFQDTDFTQYRIFSTIYLQSEDCAWFVIGDPKQAIYGFRGADVFTYMAAKKAISSHYFLDTNWRSSQNMVDAINTLFEQCASPFFYEDSIPFISVKAGSHKNTHAINVCLSSLPTRSQAALQFYLLASDEPINLSHYKQRMADECANEISRLLSVSSVQAGTTTKIQANDIAVLVKDFYEAEFIRRCLLDRHIESVYVSNRDSVFDSQEAHDLYLVLAAVLSLSVDFSVRAGQGSERAIRSALSTQLLAYSQRELEQQFFDEKNWLEILLEFKYYHQLLVSQGVLVMFYQFFQQRAVLARLARLTHYERRMTNVLHVVDLLQAICTEQTGTDDLLPWFAEQLESHEGGADEQILRVDTDNNRVQIVTIHKSKGLEYPLVFLPFACAHKPAKDFLYYDELQQTRVFDLLGLDASKDQAERERLAEDMRLLYVALTRSKFRCYVGVADVCVGNSKQSVLARSALGRLVLNGEASSAFATKLQALEKSCSAIALIPVSNDLQEICVCTPDSTTQKPQMQAREFKGHINSAWRMSSFTALTQSHGIKNSQALSRLELDVLEDKAPLSATLLSERNAFSFPRGTEAGILLHSIFEEIDFTCIDESVLLQQVQKKLLLFGFDPQWQETLVKLIKTVLETPLEKTVNTTSIYLSLNKIPASKKLVELEFTLPCSGIKSAELSTFEKALVVDQELSALSVDLQQGFIRGFIDLIFEWQGNFYVLDYKSNHLGNSYDDYAQSKLEQAMSEHHYRLQYLIYCLALHRFLQQRIPSYHYDSHFGGVYYVFVRGMQKDVAGSGVYFKKPQRSLIEMLDQRFKGKH